MGVHRTCGEPDEIELTPMGVELHGPGRVPGPASVMPLLFRKVRVPSRDKLLEMQNRFSNTFCARS